MSKRLNSKYSVCKKIKNRYKNLWGLKNKDFFRSTLFKRKKKKRFSHFNKLLNIKQCYKLFYSNLNEKTLKKFTKISINSPSKTIDKLTSFLEERLDALLFRSCFVSSFHQARQLINHGFIYVNGFCIRNFGKKLFPGDIITIKHLDENKINFLNKLTSRSIPSYLEIDLRSLSFIFLWDPRFKNSYFPVRKNFKRISRYYR